MRNMRKEPAMSERNVSSSGKRRLAVVGITSVGVTALVAVLAFAALALHVRPAYGSGSGGGGGGCYNVSGPTCTFSGHQAYAGFGTVGSDGCTYTSAYVQAYDNLTSPGRTATQTVFISFSKWSCDGSYIAYGDNMDWNTGLPNFTGTLKFDSATSTVTIDGTANMTDYSTNTPFTSTINLTWKGYGPTTTFIDNSHIRMPGFLMNSHFSGSSQMAEASGAITDATGTNVATPATLDASTNDDSGGTVQISRQ
jgi:hypothetical protein